MLTLVCKQKIKTNILVIPVTCLSDMFFYKKTKKQTLQIANLQFYTFILIYQGNNESKQLLS